MNKVIAFDLDGTLIDAQNEIIGKHTIELLNELKNDFEYCIVTGRLEHDCIYINNKYQLNIKNWISENGAVFRRNNEVHAKILDKQVALELLKIIKDYPIRLEINTISNRYWTSERDPLLPKEFYDSHHIVEDYTDIIIYQPVVLFLIVGEYQVLKKLQEALMKKNYPITATMTSYTSLEILSENVSKGKALNKMFPHSIIYAIGDSESDETMSVYSRYYNCNEHLKIGTKVKNIEEALRCIQEENK